jgi:hypothetical protein
MKREIQFPPAVSPASKRPSSLIDCRILTGKAWGRSGEPRRWEKTMKIGKLAQLALVIAGFIILCTLYPALEQLVEDMLRIVFGH